MNLQGLIVGLGNPGDRYRDTRHNYGFMLADALTEKGSDRTRLTLGKGAAKLCDLERITLPGTKSQWLVCKPMTYMNESGQAVARVSQFYKIELENIMVLHDELDLPVGRMKMKLGGGNAGHNGLRSISQHLGSNDFYRLRLGVGKPNLPGQDTRNFVLSSFSLQERDAVRDVLDAALQGLRLFATEGFTSAQQFVNGFSISLPSA